MTHDRDAALFAAVYTDPDGDGPRSILADHLLQRGDPRGEVIALDLAARGITDKKALDQNRRRRGELVGANAAAWFPEVLRPVLRDDYWDAGFLVGGLVAPRSADAFLRSIPAPEWETLRALSCTPSGPEITSLVGDLLDRARNLKAFAAVPRVLRDTLGQMVEPAPWHTIVTEPGRVDEWPALTRERFPHLDCIVVLSYGERVPRDVVALLQTLPWVRRIDVDFVASGENIYRVHQYYGGLLEVAVHRAKLIKR